MAMRAGDKETAKTQLDASCSSRIRPPEIRADPRRAARGTRRRRAGAAARRGAAAMARHGRHGRHGRRQAGGGSRRPTGRTIRIAVSVDPALAGKLQARHARCSSRRASPAFRVRRSRPCASRSDELPTTVVLSDANSMIEGRNLSSVDDVEVVARVAFGGTAVTASGDLIGEARPEEGRRRRTWTSSSTRSRPSRGERRPPRSSQAAVGSGRVTRGSLLTRRPPVTEVGEPPEYQRRRRAACASMPARARAMRRSAASTPSHGRADRRIRTCSRCRCTCRSSPAARFRCGRWA